MAINVSQAFHRTSANPVDESMALTKAQMLTVNDNLMPAYYFTICQDDGKIYLYDKSATASAITGKFKEFEGGGGGGGTAGSVYTGTLLASGWNSNTKQQTLTFTSYDASYHGVIGLPADATAAQMEEYRNCLIRTVSQSGATVTFECEEIPSINLPVEIYCGGESGSGGGAEAFIVTVTMDGSENLTADKTPKQLEDAIADNAIVKANFPMYGLVLDLSVAAGGNFAFSTFYIEDATDISTIAFGTILMVKDTDSAWDSITMQTLQGDKFSKEPLEIHFANNAVDVTYSELGEALSANRTLKLIDTENDVVLAFTGYYSGAYYFSTICLNRRQEMVNTSIVLYHQAMGSDVVATQVQRLTLTEDVQKTEMPTADSTYLNKIYQYIGTTDANFTNGLFYRCVNTSGTTYTWQECETQHRLTPSEMADIMSTLPGATTNYPKYSTTEQVVGEWIDGKPIYQKTFECGAITTGTSKEITHGISNISKVVDISGIAINSSSDVALHITYSYVGGSSPQTITAEYHGSKIIIFPIGIGTGYEVYVTLRYTKTTD